MFFSLQQSAFLHALGSAIGNSLWQLGALWLLFAAISGLSKLTAANRYRLAVTFSMAGFLWFLFSLVNTFVSLPANGNFSNYDNYQNTASNYINEGFKTKVSFFYHSFLASLNSLSPYISCAYLFVWLLLTTRLVNGFRQVRQFGSQGLGKANDNIEAFVQKHAALLQIQKQVRTFTSEFVQGPLTIGFFKPIILLPIASMSNLSPAQVEAILLHELAHIKRHDYLINIFVQIAEISLFFNPFMRLLLKEIKQERENCCDDYVLQFQYNAADYAKALLGIAQNRTSTLLAMAARNSQFQLLNRVKRMVAPQPQTFNYRQQLSLLLLLTFLGLIFTIVAPNPTSHIQPLTKTIVIKENNKIETIKETKLIKQSENGEAPFDFVKYAKSVAHISQLDPVKDADQIEKETKEIEKHSKELEAQTKKLTANALKNAQPMIENAEKFAKTFSDKMASTAKNDNRFLEGGDLNDYIESVIDNVNESMKQISSQNIAPMAPPAPPAPPAVPAMVKIAIAKQRTPERKSLYNREWLSAQQLKVKKNMDSLQAAFGERIEAKQQSFDMAQEKLAALKNKDNWDFTFEENAKQAGLAIAQKAMRQVFKSIKIKIPKNICIENLPQDVQIQLQNNNKEIIADEDVENIHIDNINTKPIKIHQSSTIRNGKEPNVIIINFTSSL